MNQDREALLVVKGKGVKQLLYRILLSIWIVYAIFLWDYNPVFFLISIIASIMLICFNTNDSIIIRNNEFEINYKSWIPLFNSSFHCFYYEIEEVSYGKEDKALLNLIRRLLFAGIDVAVKQRNIITVKTVENKIYSFTPNIPEEGFYEALDLINLHIQNVSSSKRTAKSGAID